MTVGDRSHRSIHPGQKTISLVRHDARTSFARLRRAKIARALELTFLLRRGRARQMTASARRARRAPAAPSRPTAQPRTSTRRSTGGVPRRSRVAAAAPILPPAPESSPASVGIGSVASPPPSAVERASASAHRAPVGRRGRATGEPVVDHAVAVVVATVADLDLDRRGLDALHAVEAVAHVEPLLAQVGVGAVAGRGDVVRQRAHAAAAVDCPRRRRRCSCRPCCCRSRSREHRAAHALQVPGRDAGPCARRARADVVAAARVRDAPSSVQATIVKVLIADAVAWPHLSIARTYQVCGPTEKSVAAASSACLAPASRPRRRRRRSGTWRRPPHRWRRPR